MNGGHDFGCPPYPDVQMAALEKLILERLSPIPGVEKIRSSFALKQVRYKTALPLPPANTATVARFRST